MSNPNAAPDIGAKLVMPGPNLGGVALQDLSATLLRRTPSQRKPNHHKNLESGQT
jgi:hypothetical protein